MTPQTYLLNAKRNSYIQKHFFFRKKFMQLENFSPFPAFLMVLPKIIEFDELGDSTTRPLQSTDLQITWAD